LAGTGETETPDREHGIAYWNFFDRGRDAQLQNRKRRTRKSFATELRHRAWEPGSLSEFFPERARA
jgi:hypothetical protein